MNDHQQAPSPALLFETLGAYQKTATLKAAIELDLFSAIAAGKVTPKALAGELPAAERGVRILCDHLVVMGFLTKAGDSYGLTPDSAIFLVKQSPAYMGGCIEFLLSPHLMSSFQDVAAMVRKGGTVADEEGTLAPEHPIWVTFARAMAPMMAMPAQLMAQLVNGNTNRELKALDIAAGHGTFGIAVAQRYPNARVFALDWANVLQVAQENAVKAGVAERFSLLAGSAFEVDYGSGYDVILLPNFLHHFDVATCETLLAKVHAALADGGRAMILDFIPNEDRVSPPIPASFALMMLGSTPTGDVYTFNQLESMCRNAGFSRSELHPLPGLPQQVVVGYR